MIQKFLEYYQEKREPTKVSSQEFMKKRERFRMDDFSDSERKKMIDILKSKKNVDRFSLNPEYIEIYLSWKSIEIVKFTDEWFTIIEEDRWNQNNTYYICDEFEEVETYLTKIM